MKKIEVYVEQTTSLLVSYLPSIVGAILVWIVGSWLIRRVTLLSDKAMRARKLDVSLEGFVHSLVNVGLKILLLFSIAGMLGIQTTSFVTVLGAAGLAIGLALQGSLGNFAGGVLILIFRPFKVGDIITAQGQNGKVESIQIFNTILVTPDKHTIIIPNGPLSNGVITNFSAQGMLGFDIQVEIDGRHDFEQVKAIALQVLQSDTRIANPETGIAKLAAGMVVSMKGQTLPDDNIPVTGLLNEKIKVAFAKNGFSAPEVHTFVHSMT